MGNLSKDLEQLKIWRESNARRSTEIIELWLNSICDNLQKLGSEKHLILEQVCIAAFDTYQMGIAQKCIQELFADFPNSLRVKKYEAMFFEADERYDEALEVLEEIIQQESTHSGARKRKVAILKAQGKNVEAIKELVDYLKVYMADVEAWQELSELYISEQDFGKAGFCLEELILHNPHNHLLHQRYADIKYTQGGLDNLDLAKAYYCQAIRLNPRNMRALYGLQLTTVAIASSQKCPAPKKKDVLKLADWVSTKIKKIYESQQFDNVASHLLALQLNQGNC